VPRLNITAGHEASVESRGPGVWLIREHRGPGGNGLGKGRGGHSGPGRERQHRVGRGSERNGERETGGWGVIGRGARG
jgi:hypothetical protein